MHLQDQILNSLKATLIAARTTAASRVYLEGVDTIETDATPALQIDIGPETVDVISVSRPRTVRRTLDVFIRIVVAQNSAYRVAAGNLLAQVETALHATDVANSAGGIAPDGLTLIATDPDRDGNAATVTYAIRSLWRMRYLTKENAPSGVPPAVPLVVTP